MLMCHALFSSVGVIELQTKYLRQKTRKHTFIIKTVRPGI